MKRTAKNQLAPSWTLTFGDMMSLILTFFVMLVSMASFEPARFHATMQSLQGAFGVLDGLPSLKISPPVPSAASGSDEAKRMQIRESASRLARMVQLRGIGDAARVEVTETGVAIQLRDIGFASGSADLDQKGVQVIQDIAEILKGYPELKVRVEGHTDDVPMSSIRYHNNWELSAARALSVVELLQKYTGIKPGNMSATGYGEYRPLVPNLTEEDRARNRRIQIFVDYLDQSKGGPNG